ncbi:MAG: cbb3-type cytochrome oxidase assembly protein CcoS [Myxococcales bacterium FL481]|nr:MAG: cbb3-type cytochrome oxidase assembly protein CcoS [Myxococcales bacterium FL481]
MEILYVLVPLAAVFLGLALLAFRWACRDGQFDDLQTPAMRILFDERRRASEPKLLPEKD